jgi:hypothetical protein
VPVGAVDPIWRAAAMALARWLEQNGKLHRPIGSLEMHELEGICVAVVSGHQDARIAQAKVEGEAAKIRDLFA